MRLRVGANTQVAVSPSIDGCGVGELLTTCQAAGAVTVNRKLAFRSGCSNTANMRRLSGTSNCE